MRDGGRIVSVAAIIAMAVNTDGRREIVGLGIEPLRVSRRLQLLRGWSHDEASSPIFP
jgi:transposase-like protein